MWELKAVQLKWQIRLNLKTDSQTFVNYRETSSSRLTESGFDIFAGNPVSTSPLVDVNCNQAAGLLECTVSA
ncbi:MAG: hypothetical protein R3C20_03905 [Planctomycetaceae bacterium]